MSRIQGGKLLEPTNFRNACYALHNRHSINWSSKATIIRDIEIPDMGIMVKLPSDGSFSVLVENIQCILEDFNGNVIAYNAKGLANINTQNTIPAGLVGVKLTEVDGTALTTVLINREDNLSSPVQIHSKVFQEEEMVARYYYTYCLINLGVTSTIPTDGLALISHFQDASGDVNLDNLTTFRTGYDHTSDVRIDPILDVGSEISINPTQLIADSFLERTIMQIPLFSLEDKSTTTIDFLDISKGPFKRGDYFKVELISTSSSTALAPQGSMSLISSNIALYKTGYYRHTYIFNTRDVAGAADDRIKFNTPSTLIGMYIELDHMYNENNGLSALLTLPAMNDSQPLTQIYINAVLKSAATYLSNLEYKNWTFSSRKQAIFDSTTQDYITSDVGLFKYEEHENFDLIPISDDPTNPNNADLLLISKEYIALNNHLTQAQAEYNGELDYIADGVTWSISFTD